MRISEGAKVVVLELWLPVCLLFSASRLVLLGIFEAVSNISESQRFDGSISLQTLNFYFSYEDVLFYFK